ncbi:MAG: WecB/TagA/CpsF family glycosyltransferase [Candidatus Buchananbacteria bacterium]|nr:WecB/TagA/CpsF family glycosyltransferase [Candidatus Buchananbacteria bacterium]
MKQEILGVNIDNIGLKESIGRISDFLKSDGQHYIVTVNAEFIVAAQKNEAFKKVLNQASLALCDGFGPILASGGKLQRVIGVDLSAELLKGQVEEAKIFLLGGEEGSAKRVASKYPQTVVGAERGGIINQEKWLLDNNEIILNKINASGANILLVGFGQVKQEMWIKRNLEKMPAVKVAMGVGGTFDYLSGQVRRAPKFLRSLGLEWLFRLLIQPQRIGRIFNATVKFLWLVMFDKKAN